MAAQRSVTAPGTSTDYEAGQWQNGTNAESRRHWFRLLDRSEGTEFCERVKLARHRKGAVTPFLLLSAVSVAFSNCSSGGI